MTTLRLLLACMLLSVAGCSKKSDEKAEPEPATDKAETSSDQPKADEPKADKPTTDEPATDEPKADEPKADEPKADEPKADEPKADEPVDAKAAPTPPDNSPKDLQVLPKSWSDKKVRDYMKNTVNRGLGVKCSHCHDTKNYADNSKTAKEVTRDMIKMQDRINKKDFGGKPIITCFTCHKGKVKVPK